MIGLGRIPDAGADRRDRQGPRTAVPRSVVEQIVRERAAGATIPEIACRHRLSTRTIHRYLVAGPDPARTIVADAIREVGEIFEIRALTPDRVSDLAHEIVFRLRNAGRLD